MAGATWRGRASGQMLQPLGLAQRARQATAWVAVRGVAGSGGGGDGRRAPANALLAPSAPATLAPQRRAVANALLAVGAR